jgi:hypothetical protein
MLMPEGEYGWRSSAMRCEILDAIQRPSICKQNQPKIPSEQTRQKILNSAGSQKRFH